MSTAVPDLEPGTADDVLAYALESFGPRLTVACSFQKEESVLFELMSQAVGETGTFDAFVIDTGVLFPETLATWERFSERFPRARLQTIDARSPGEPWTQENCCGAAKVAGLEQALADVEAWVTGIRRQQSPTRSATPKLERDERRAIWKLNPLADWSEKDVWSYIFAHGLPYNPLHDEGYDSIGCAPCTLPGSGRDGRWAGQARTECGIHLP